MPRSIRVTPEDLHMSAATVDAHADDVWLKHGAAHGRIEAAQVGVPTGSAAALSAALTKWQAETTSLFSRMVEHGGGLRDGAAAYEQVDQDGAADIAAGGDEVPDIGL